MHLGRRGLSRLVSTQRVFLGQNEFTVESLAQRKGERVRVNGKQKKMLQMFINSSFPDTGVEVESLVGEGSETGISPGIPT